MNNNLRKIVKAVGMNKLEMRGTMVDNSICHCDNNTIPKDFFFIYVAIEIADVVICYNTYQASTPLKNDI